MSKYDDIINLPHHVSKNHPQMSMHDRAAQFAPFSALVGYEDAVHEVGRQTTERIELDEQAKAELNRRLTFLLEHLADHPIVTIEYFVPDASKTGGSYQTVTGYIEKFSPARRSIKMNGGITILIRNIFAINAENRCS